MIRRTLPVPPRNIVPLAMLALACMPERPVATAVDPAQDLTVQVLDSRGSERPADATPRRPFLVVEGPGLVDRDVRAWLLRATEGPALEPNDLVDSAGELRRAAQAREIPAEATREASKVWVAPRTALARGQPYHLLLAIASTGTRWSGVLLKSLRAGDTATAGACPSAAWPSDAMAGVPMNLGAAALAFDGAVENPEQTRIDGPDGTLPLESIDRRGCDSLGLVGDDCIVLTPAARLAPNATYRWVVPADVLDATGAGVGPWSAEFRTGNQADEDPPGWLTLECLLDEVSTPVGCLLTADTAVQLRLQPLEPARVYVESADAGARSATLLGLGEFVLGPLAQAQAGTLWIEATDLAGHTSVEHVPFETTPALAPLYITEVCADPTGREPDAEFVEVVNFGAVPIDLQGFSISDRAATLGDTIEAQASIAAGGVALIVSDRFDASAADGGPVPPGVPLIRIGTSLATGGLTNAGEPLYLRDPIGRRLSTLATTAAGAEGRCLHREPGTFDRLAFTASGERFCTPGRIDP